MALPTVRREQLAEALADKFSSLKKREAVALINYLFELIKNSLISGKQVKIPGFGTFRVRVRKEREARNPKTGERITIPAKKLVKFYSAKDLKEALK